MYDDYEQRMADYNRFYTEQAMSFSSQHGKTLGTIFFALIAGLLAIVIKTRVTYWSGLCFLVAAGLAAIGLACALFHMYCTYRLLREYAARYSSSSFPPPETIPLPPKSISILDQPVGMMDGKSYALTLVFLALSVAGAAMGLACLLWNRIGLGGFMIASLTILGLTCAAVYIVLARDEPKEKKNAE